MGQGIKALQREGRDLNIPKIVKPYLWIISKGINDFFCLLSVANGVYQNTVYGVAAKLPFKYVGAVVLGSVSLHLYQGTTI